MVDIQGGVVVEEGIKMNTTWPLSILDIACKNVLISHNFMMHAMAQCKNFVIRHCIL